MTKIQHPQTPRMAHSPAAQIGAQSPEGSQHGPAVADAMAASHAASDTSPLQLHLPIPANLRPFRAHISARPAASQPPSPQGDQAWAVAQGSIGLVDLTEPPAVPISGIWSSPTDHFSDTSSMIMGGQKTMALLASIDHHVGVWAAMLGHDRD